MEGTRERARGRERQRKRGNRLQARRRDAVTMGATNVINKLAQQGLKKERVLG